MFTQEIFDAIYCCAREHLLAALIFKSSISNRLRKLPVVISPRIHGNLFATIAKQSGRSRAYKTLSSRTGVIFFCFADECEGEHKARGERGARVTRKKTNACSVG